MKHVYLTFFCLCLTQFGMAQQKQYSGKDYAREPVWITMIRDTSVNFFEAEKAFNTYFEKHELPGGENEVIGEQPKITKLPSKREQRKMQQENRMRMEVKKYKHWHDMMLPYVQPDGHILTPSERLKIYQSQKNK